jgi:RNA polymerase sigma factor (sigma-70 family)
MYARKQKAFSIARPGGYDALRDEQLILACQIHDPLAFAALYKRYRRFVYATLYRLAPDWSNIHDDLVQDVFMRVWGCIGTLKNPLAFKTWLNRLISNLFLDTVRKHRLTTISLDEPIKDRDGETDVCLDIADTRSLPDECFERKEVMLRLTEAVSRLPKQFGIAVVLREYDGLEYEQIATLMGSSIGTVKSRIARGRAKIQSRLKSMIA